MAPVELTCRDFVDFLSDYVEGEIGGTDRECFEAHLVECPDCVTYLATFRETLRLGRAWGGEDGDVPLADAPRELVAAVLEARRRATRR
jgi:anti-sigma factor RsiW